MYGIQEGDTEGVERVDLFFKRGIKDKNGRNNFLPFLFISQINEFKIFRSDFYGQIDRELRIRTLYFTFIFLWLYHILYGITVFKTEFQEMKVH